MFIIMGFFFLLLNFIISLWNARTVGKSWIEANQMGGFPLFMAWCGAIMSASGFTYVYIFIITLILSAFGKISSDTIQAMLQLGYLVIVIPVLGSGLAIWLSSIRNAWRKRNFANIGVAGWNTFAMVYNTYRAASAIPSSIRGVTGFFGSKKKDLSFFIILAVLVALFGGMLTTYMIVMNTAKSEAKDIIGHRPAY